MIRPQPARPGATMLAAAGLALAGCVSSSPASANPPGQQISAAAPNPSATSPPPPVLVVVVRVLDGDTVDLRPTDPKNTAGVRAERVRLLGVDAPETAHAQPAQCGADDATQALAEQLRHGPATLTLDAVSGDHDRYGRTLGYLQVDGHDVALALVRAGVVEAWHPPSAPAPTRYPLYAAAQTQAQVARAGSWASCATLGR